MSNMPKSLNAAAHKAVIRPVRSKFPEADDATRWIDDEEQRPGRSWAMILIFAVVPLTTLVALCLACYALVAQLWPGASVP